MTLETMISDVLPEDCVITKFNHGMFAFYRDDFDYDNDISFASQQVNESFFDFISRVIKELIESEVGENDPLVTIDHAINLCPDVDFGDYVVIEQKRHGAENEHYLHKVIGKGKSNMWVDVPVQSPAKETIHDHMEEVVRCVCCGAEERDVIKYRLIDVQHNS